MKPNIDTICIAFSGDIKISSGPILKVAEATKKHLIKKPNSDIQIFDHDTGQFLEVDFRGSLSQVVERMKKSFIIETEKIRGPGRPKLGVVSKEITLLPKHWDWLNLQANGASGSIRKLIDEAMKRNVAKDELKRSQNSVYKFMTIMAGNYPLYEEALRAFYANDNAKFKYIITNWPKDVRDHLLKMTDQIWST